MKTIVMKFGGTSVADAESVKNVINIVKNERRNKLVVVSAIARATTALETIARNSSLGNEIEAYEILEEIINRHYKMTEELVYNNSLKTEAIEKMKLYKSQIEMLIKGLSIIRELSLRTLDAFRVFGELMSSTVIYFAFKESGIDTELIDSRDIIKTNNDFSRAYPDFAKTELNVISKVKPLIDSGKVVLAQGFIASTEDGISTTMGRESSDFSAAIYGSLLDAEEIQIWTDVDGVLTSDPGLISGTLKLNEISFAEMEELSFFGAKVLHRNSVKPAREKNIPLRILNSKNTASSGTRVISELNYHEKVKSITYKKNVIVLKLTPRADLNQYIFWEMMLNILSRHKPQIDILLSSSSGILIVIAENAYTRIHYDELRNEFSEISSCEIIKDKVLITIVGSELNSIEGFFQRIFVSCPHLKPESLCFGFNRHSLSILVDTGVFEETIKNLHREFFTYDDSGLFERIKKQEERLIA
ncbi:MAG: aspartate kinase [Ignavibacteria bacterium]|nr:aspartate kinase [Ignavibacteria bacterium]